MPYDRRMPFVRIRTRLAHHLLGQRFVVRVDSWPKHSKYPEGHVAKVLGPINDLRAESQAVLEQTGIVWQVRGVRAQPAGLEAVLRLVLSLCALNGVVVRRTLFACIPSPPQPINNVLLQPGLAIHTLHLVCVAVL